MPSEDIAFKELTKFQAENEEELTEEEFTLIESVLEILLDFR